MRSKTEINPAFVVGLASGLVLGGVTLLAAGAVRRALAARRASAMDELGPFIDGVHHAGDVEIDLRPPEDGGTHDSPPRLQSEMPEFVPMSQRW
jgi:hypothetical protein